MLQRVGSDFGFRPSVLASIAQTRFGDAMDALPRSSKSCKKTSFFEKDVFFVKKTSFLQNVRKRRLFQKRRLFRTLLAAQMLGFGSCLPLWLGFGSCLPHRHLGFGSCLPFGVLKRLDGKQLPKPSKRRIFQQSVFF